MRNVLFTMQRVPFCWFCCCPVSLRPSCIMILVYFTIFQCSIIGSIFVLPEAPFKLQMISLFWNVFVILWILVALYGIDQRKPKLLIPQAFLQRVQLLLLAMFMGYAIGVLRDKFSPSVYSDTAYVSAFLFVVTLNGYFIMVIDSYHDMMLIK